MKQLVSKTSAKYKDATQLETKYYVKDDVLQQQFDIGFLNLNKNNLKQFQ